MLAAWQRLENPYFLDSNKYPSWFAKIDYGIAYAI